MNNRGFTLVELLASIAIIAVLASLVVAGTSSARKSAERSQALSNLRQIGVGILSYTGDNGHLPGKLWPGQIPVIDLGDSGRPPIPGRLASILAPYLGIENPQNGEVVKVFLPLAFRREKIAPKDARTYVMNMSMPLDDGTFINVWGSEADPASAGPSPLNRIPKRIWLMSDADQLHPRVSSKPWKSFTPLKPIHGAQRQALFSDGSAATVSEEELL